MTYIRTRTGAHFDFVSAAPDFRLTDIGHALSQINRFGGHTNQPWSVAQHSLFVYELLKVRQQRVEKWEENGYDLATLPENFLLEGLMHDAQEAYLGDMPTPLKKLLPDYCELENAIQKQMRHWIGLPGLFVPPDVHDADRNALIFEARAFMEVDPVVEWGYDYPTIHPYDHVLESIRDMPPAKAAEVWVNLVMAEKYDMKLRQENKHKHTLDDSVTDR